MVLVEQLERQALADRQALLSRGITDDLPTALSAQRHFDEWLADTTPAVKQQPMTAEQRDRHDELVALGVR